MFQIPLKNGKKISPKIHNFDQKNDLRYDKIRIHAKIKQNPLISSIMLNIHTQKLKKYSLEPQKRPKNAEKN